jgi:hypothetical protein
VWDVFAEGMEKFVCKVDGHNYFHALFPDHAAGFCPVQLIGFYGFIRPSLIGNNAS